MRQSIASGAGEPLLPPDALVNNPKESAMRRHRTCARSAVSIQNGARNRQDHTSSPLGQPGQGARYDTLALDMLARTYRYRSDAPDAQDVLAALATLNEIASRVLDVSSGLTDICAAALAASDAARDGRDTR